MVRLASATLLLLAPIHVANAGSLTFLKATKEHQQVEPQKHHGMGHGMGMGKHQRHGHKKAASTNSTNMLASTNGMGMGKHHKHQHSHRHQHRGECWEHRPVHKRFAKASLLQLEQTPRSLQDPHLALPGAGLHPDDIEPFQMVTKDGFLLTACVKDQMLEHGDKFGNGKHRYNIGSDVSIVHYSEIIPKEDREKMTIEKCFDFCRTVPNMVYFGLNMGRDCYCTPFYKQMPGGSENCDQVCEGNPSQMCGGKTMSSIFEMHSCDDTRSNLEDVITEVEDEIFLKLQDMADHVQDVADEALYDATEMQGVWGAAGASDQSAFMQQAKVYSGVLEKHAQNAVKLVNKMQDPYDAASVSLNRNLRDFDNLKVAEDAIKALKEGLEEAKQMTYDTKEEMKKAHPMSLTGSGSEDEPFNSTEAATQYYPIMYFADDDFRTKYVVEGSSMWVTPTTCTGNLLQIVFGASADDCAHACDGLPGKCDGFQYMAFNDGICFVFESIKTVLQWKGCKPAGEEPNAPFDSGCYGKLSRLEGVGGIAPRKDKVLEEARKIRQGTGKCAHCLESMDEWDRCYEYGTECIGNEHDMQLYAEWAMPYYNRPKEYYGIHKDYANSCERLGDNNPGWCTWEWGRPNYYQGSGQWLQAAQVCPQCGYCKANGKASTGQPWTDEHWSGDPINGGYYYYYYYY